MGKKFDSSAGPITLAILLVVAMALAACSPTQGGGSTAPPAAAGPSAVCDRLPPGPTSPPPGAISVDPAVVGDLVAKTKANPAGSTFWLQPGTHTLGDHQFDQVAAKDGSTYIGAPGAIVDGAGKNQYAFTTRARDVTIRHLTVRGFVPPQDQGVVNHDSGDGWIIENNTVENNKGAGVMAGAGQQVRYNCLRNNGQYGLDAYAPGNTITGLVVEQNEIVGNNTEDWETKVPGCGCTGGAKFWSVNGADIRGNWVHDNHGPGLWADTNNNDLLIENNLIENNDSAGIFYETSYNLILRGNMIRGNAMVMGKRIAESGDNFPTAAIYISESGGEPRLKARTDRIEIYNNVLENNWSGITAWENADRFCNSPANTSTGYCTPLASSVEKCIQPGIGNKPLYDDCRWKTQRLDIHDNKFVYSPAVVGCTNRLPGRMALLSNYGTFPDWSPYKGAVIQEAISTVQGNRWYNNRYAGPWTFLAPSTDKSLTIQQWQEAPFQQDAGSTFQVDDAAGEC